MKNHKIFNILLFILASIFLIFNFYNIFKYKFLDFYYINYILCFLSLTFFIFLAINIVKNKLRLFISIALVISLFLSYFLNAYMSSAIRLFNTINKNTEYSEYTMSLVVLKDSNYQTLDDVKNITALVPKSLDLDNIELLSKKLLEEKSFELKTNETTAYISAYESLLNHSTELIVMNSAYENIIELTHSDYHKNIRKLYEYKIKVEKNPKKVATKSDILNIYISGIDTYGEITSISRSDVNLIMTVNKATNKIIVTTTPRDAYVRIADGGANEYDKLTHSGVYGIDASIHTLENLYEIDIDYYVRINFTSFLKIIDVIDGVDIYNETEFTSKDGIYFPQDTIHLDSKKALSFVRERYNLAGGDRDRGKNQQKVLVAIIKKLSNISSLTNYEKIITEASSTMQTDISLETIMSLVNEQIANRSEYEITSQALEGHGTMGKPSYAMPGYNLYMMEIDEDSLKNVKENIKSVMESKS